MSVSMLAADGTEPAFFTVPMPGGTVAAGHVPVDITGTPSGTAGNPLRTAPAIAAFTPLNRGGSIGSAGVVAFTSNAGRKGGWVQALWSNQSFIFVTFADVIVSVLAAGQSCSLELNGYVFLGQVTLTGTVVGDAWLGLEAV